MRKSHEWRIDSTPEQRFRTEAIDQHLENHRAGTIFRKSPLSIYITPIPLFYGLFGYVPLKTLRQRYPIGQLC